MPLPAVPLPEQERLAAEGWPGAGGPTGTFGPDTPSQSRLAAALAAGRTAAWQSNLQTRERWWTPEMFALHGLPPDSGEVPADYMVLVEPEDRDIVAAAFHRSITEGSHAVQYRVVWPDGTRHWLEGVGRATVDHEGRPHTITGVCTLIDDRKQEEADLLFHAQASAEFARTTDYEETLRKVAALAVPRFADWCAVDMLDADGSLRRLAVAHVEPDKVSLAEELHRRYPPDPAAPVGGYRVARTGEPEVVPVITDELLQASARDAEHLAIIRSLGLTSYMGVPIVGARGVLGVMTFVASDSNRSYSDADLQRALDLVSRAAVAIQNAELFRALRQSDAAKDVFLATLAHELRNPLAPLANGLALLERRATEPQVREVLPIFGRQLRQLTRLVDDLLEVARINSGKFELRTAHVDVRDVLQAAVEAGEPEASRASHQLTVELPPQPVPVHGDHARLLQVFSNLLANSVRYTPGGGRIGVTLSAGEGVARVVISDNGIGIAPELLPKVFDLFTQGTDRSGHGLGIGLYLVRQIVRLHGGEVLVHSEGRHRGATFTVQLPLGTVDTAAAEPSAAPVVASKRILVVDDNLDAAQTLAQLLEMLGHVAFVAHDGATAIRLALGERPDVILLDIGLPDMSGYEVAQRLRELAIDTPHLIALTGWGQTQDKQRSRAMGFDEHWTKPIDFQRLEAL